MSQWFDQPFRLEEDPKQQDQWTTYVEYLEFECWWLGKCAGSTERLIPQYDAAWEKLVQAEVVKPSETHEVLATTEAEAMRRCKLEQAAGVVHSLTAATYANSKADTDAKKTPETTGNAPRPTTPRLSPEETAISTKSPRRHYSTERAY